MLVGATLIAAIALGAWFPASALLHQHQQLTAAASELHNLDQKNHALEQKAAELKTPAALGRIAQQQYGLVPPGDQAYQVLPASGSGNAAVTGPGATAGGATAGGTTAGGTSSGTASRATGPAGGSGSTTTATGAAAQSGAGGFFSRVLRTLEFWR